MARFVCKADHWSISVGHVYNVRRFSTRDISDKRRPSAHEKCLPNRNRVTQVQSRRKHYLKSKKKKEKKKETIDWNHVLVGNSSFELTTRCSKFQFLYFELSSSQITSLMHLIRCKKFLCFLNLRVYIFEINFGQIISLNVILRGRKFLFYWNWILNIFLVLSSIE